MHNISHIFLLWKGILNPPFTPKTIVGNSSYLLYIFHEVRMLIKTTQNLPLYALFWTRDSPTFLFYRDVNIKTRRGKRKQTSSQTLSYRVSHFSSHWIMKHMLQQHLGRRMSMSKKWNVRVESIAIILHVFCGEPIYLIVPCCWCLCM